MTRTLIAMRLRRTGRHVTERVTGEEAARLVLSDPGHTGVILAGELSDGSPGAFAAWLRDDPATRSVPLLAILRRDRPELAAAARAGGADAVLSLPIDLDEVLHHVGLAFSADSRERAGRRGDEEWRQPIAATV